VIAKMDKSHQLALDSFDKAAVAVREEFSKLPDGYDVSNRVVLKLQGTFDRPPVGDYEFIIRKTFTEDEVRSVLFQPTPDQVWYFTAVFTAGLAVPKDHSFRRLLSLHLTLVFLIHRYAISWRSLFTQ
jgi:hypothetical protein